VENKSCYYDSVAGNTLIPPLTLIKSTNTMKKVITLSDIQYPDNIDLSGVFKFIKDQKPDEIIYIGDIINADGISRYWTGDKEEGVYNTVLEIEGFVKDVHSKIKAAAPKAKIVMTGGNHLEARVRKAINEKLFRERLLDLKKYLPDVKILEYGLLYNVGKLHWTHGYYFGGNVAKKHLDVVDRNLIFGHTHTVTEWTKKSPIEDKPIFAKSIGCLCDLNPHYAHNMPNQWANAIHISYVFPDGSFQEFTIRITDGKFFYDGKWYSGRK